MPSRPRRAPTRIAPAFGPSSASSRSRVAERVREGIESQSVCGVRLRVSMGLAVAGPDGHDGAEVLAAADERMYEDKRARKGQLRLAA